MKIEKFREMSPNELKHKLFEIQDNLFKLKIKVQTKQVENTAQLAGLRRDIARIKTLLHNPVQPGSQKPAPDAAKEIKNESPEKTEKKSGVKDKAKK